MPRTAARWSWEPSKATPRSSSTRPICAKTRASTPPTCWPRLRTSIPTRNYLYHRRRFSRQLELGALRRGSRSPRAIRHCAAPRRGRRRTGARDRSGAARDARARDHAEPAGDPRIGDARAYADIAGSQHSVSCPSRSGSTSSRAVSTATRTLSSSGYRIAAAAMVALFAACATTQSPDDAAVCSAYSAGRSHVEVVADGSITRVLGVAPGRVSPHEGFLMAGLGVQSRRAGRGEHGLYGIHSAGGRPARRRERRVRILPARRCRSLDASRPSRPPRRRLRRGRRQAL